MLDLLVDKNCGTPYRIIYYKKELNIIGHEECSSALECFPNMYKSLSTQPALHIKNYLGKY